MADDVVYFGSFDGYFRAVDAGDGTIRWRFKPVGSTYFPEGAIQGDASDHEGVVCFGSRDYNLYALDAARGNGHWNLRTPSCVIGAPLAHDGRVFIGTSDSRRLYAVGQRSGEVQWTQSTHARVFTAPVMFDGSLRFGGFDGRFYALAPVPGTAGE